VGGACGAYGPNKSSRAPRAGCSVVREQLQHEVLSFALRPYTVAGNYGQLLDAGTNDLEDGRFQVFEMKHLLELDDRIALPVLLYLFRRIEQRLDGSPTLIEIDEAWMALLHWLFGAKINQWLLQLRRQNAAVVLATQSPAQLAQLPNRHTVVDSCVTKIYLPNPDATTPSQAPLHRDLGLNEREITIVSEATPKRHYYLRSPRGSRLFELRLGPVALSFLAPAPAASMEETRRRIEVLIAAHGPEWPAVWLEPVVLAPPAIERGLRNAVLPAEFAELRTRRHLAHDRNLLFVRKPTPFHESSRRLG
jgi:type IV secretory pathway VirB4 component